VWLQVSENTEASHLLRHRVDILATSSPANANRDDCDSSARPVDLVNDSITLADSPDTTITLEFSDERFSASLWILTQ